MIEGIGTPAPKITIANQTPGIAKLQRQNNLVAKALNAESKDIINYLRRKQQETARELTR